MTTKTKAQHTPGTVWKDNFLPTLRQWRITTPTGKLWPKAYGTKKESLIVLTAIAKAEGGQ